MQFMATWCRREGPHAQTGLVRSDVLALRSLARAARAGRDRTRADRVVREAAEGMKRTVYKSVDVQIGDNTVSLSWVIRRPDPVSTRLKFRRRRMLRIVRAAAFKAARGNIGRPLSAEAHSSITGHVLQVCRDTAERYAHLRT